MWQSCVLSLCVCEVIVCVTMCKMVCDEGVCVCVCLCVWSYVCDRWCVTKLCVKFMYVTDGMWQSCGRRSHCQVCACVCVCEDGMWQSCVLSLCVCEVMYVTNGMWQSCGRRRRADGGGGGGSGYRIKNKNPTQSCGEVWTETPSYRWLISQHHHCFE